MRRHSSLKIPAITSVTSAFGVLQVFALVFSAEVEALPQFSRQYELKCSRCHLAPPTLNLTGRRFLENGYRFFREERDNRSIRDLIKLDRTVPAGFWLSSRPLEKKNGTVAVKPLNDARLYLAGGIYRDFSGFLRLDFEEESSPVESELATLSYNPSEILNFRFCWSSITYPDLYDTYHNSRQLTIKPNSVIDQKFGGADNGGSLSSPRQGIYFSGRLMDRLFYTLGYSSAPDDPKFLDLSTVSGRLAFEVIPITAYESFSIAVGAFGMYELDGNSNDRRFSRYAADMQVDIPLIPVSVPGVLRLMGAYLAANDKRETKGSERNYAWYAEAMYVSMSKGAPKVAPIIRFDNYAKDDGNSRFLELTANLTYYVFENFRAQLEYGKQLDVPSGVNANSSLTFQFVLLY